MKKAEEMRKIAEKSTGDLYNTILLDVRNQSKKGYTKTYLETQLLGKSISAILKENGFEIKNGFISWDNA